MWQKYIDGQYRQPTGPIGRWIGGKMARQHQPENRWTVSLLDVQPNDHILEIGFGPGIAIKAVTAKATHGLAAGIDFSKTMVSAAQRRNAAGARAGKVDLRYGDAAQLPFAENSFDKAYSIHSIYFWPDPMAVLKGIWRVLKPNGMLVLTVLPKEKWNPEHPELAGTPECKPYTGVELEAMMSMAGFREMHIETDDNPNTPSNYSVVGRK